jgi:hypothetical protein
MRLSRSFIVLEVDLSCLSYNLANVLSELLMADGVIVGRGVGAENNGGSEANDRKRAREVGSPGPSKRRTRSTTKSEEISADARPQRIQDPQVGRIIQWFLHLLASDGCACRLNGIR